MRSMKERNVAKTGNREMGINNDSNCHEVVVDLERKAAEIHRVLAEPIVDLWKLRSLALTEGGLVNDTLRKRAWPKLVGLTPFFLNSTSGTKHFDTSKKETESENTEKMRQESSRRQSKEHSRNSSRQLQSVGTISEEGEMQIDTSLLTNNNKNDDSDDKNGKLDNSAHRSLLCDVMDPSDDVEQIERDVARCTWHLLTGNQRSRRNQMESKDKSKKMAALLKRKQRRLANLINRTLVQSYSYQRSSLASPKQSQVPRLCYYQGYHDVACIFMHALGGAATTPANVLSMTQSKPSQEDPLGLNLASDVLCQVSFSHFQDNLQSDFTALQAALKLTIYPLLSLLDPEIHQHLQDAQMEPFFCLSWIITWFSHDVRDTNLCKRLFDAFLVSHPLMVIYVAIAMMLHPHNRSIILQTDCDFASLHHVLANLPRYSCDVGWKLSTQDGGYVSDHDEDDTEHCQKAKRHNTDESYHGGSDFLESDQDDDQTTSTDMASSAVAPPSIASSSNSNLNSYDGIGMTMIEGLSCRVPFQELIDMAVGYMSRYPPRCLRNHATKYYHSTEDRDDAFATDTSTPISSFDAPPAWGLNSFTPSDWVLKQRFRHIMGLSLTSRNDRRQRRRQRQENHHVARAQRELSRKEQAKLDELFSILEKTNDFNGLIDSDFLKRYSTDPAVIASGFGPGPEAVIARRKRRKKLVKAVAVGFAVMTLGFSLHYFFSYKNSNSKSDMAPTKNSTEISKKAMFLETLKGNNSFTHQLIAEHYHQDRDQPALPSKDSELILSTSIADFINKSDTEFEAPQENVQLSSNATLTSLTSNAASKAVAIWTSELGVVLPGISKETVEANLPFRLPDVKPQEMSSMDIGNSPDHEILASTTVHQVLLRLEMFGLKFLRLAIMSFQRALKQGHKLVKKIGFFLKQ